jgi:hypothetical protein
MTKSEGYRDRARVVRFIEQPLLYRRRRMEIEQHDTGLLMLQLVAQRLVAVQTLVSLLYQKGRDSRIFQAQDRAIEISR